MPEYIYSTKRGTTYVVTSPSPCTVKAVDLQGTSQTLLVTDGTRQDDFVALSSEVVITSEEQPSVCPSFSPASSSSAGGGGESMPAGVLPLKPLTPTTVLEAGAMYQLMVTDDVDLSELNLPTTDGSVATTELVLTIADGITPSVTWPIDWLWVDNKTTSGSASTLEGGKLYYFAIRTVMGKTIINHYLTTDQA